MTNFQQQLDITDDNIKKIVSDDKHDLNHKIDNCVTFYKSCLNIIRDDPKYVIGLTGINEFMCALSLKLLEHKYDFNSFITEIQTEKDFTIWCKYKTNLHPMHTKYIIPFMYYQNIIDYINFFRNSANVIENYNYNDQESYDNLINEARLCLSKNNKFKNTDSNHIVDYFKYRHEWFNNVKVTPLELYSHLCYTLNNDDFFRQIFIYGKPNFIETLTVEKLFLRLDTLYENVVLDNKDNIQNIDPSNINFDIIGDAFEKLYNGGIYSSSTLMKSCSGQYFTPQNVNNILIYLVKPKFKKDKSNNTCIESFLEPAFGSARIIQSYIRHYQRENEYLSKLSHNDRDNIDHKYLSLSELVKCFDDNIYGMDADNVAFRLGLITIMSSIGTILKYIRNINTITNRSTKATASDTIKRSGSIKDYYFNMSEGQTVEEYVNIKGSRDTSIFATRRLIHEKINESVLQNKEFKQFDIMCLNPPFGIDFDHNDFNIKDDEISTNYYNHIFPIRLSGKNSEMTFLEYTISRLKPNGRCAIILPENAVMKTTAGENLKLRKLLFSICKIKKIIMCPRGTFKYTSVPTFILYLKKIHNTSDYLNIKYKVENNHTTLELKSVTVKLNVDNLCTNQIKFYNLDDIDKEMNLHNDCKYQLRGRTQKDYDKIYLNFKNYKAKPILIANKEQIIKEKFSLSYESYVAHQRIIKLDNIENTEIEYKKLSEICKVSGASNLPKKTYNVGKYKIYQNGIDPIGYYETYNAEENTIVIPRCGYSNVMMFNEKTYISHSYRLLNLNDNKIGRASCRERV